MAWNTHAAQQCGFLIIKQIHPSEKKQICLAKWVELKVIMRSNFDTTAVA